MIKAVDEEMIKKQEDFMCKVKELKQGSKYFIRRLDEKSMI